jgi:tight adherence protein C
MMPQRLLVLKVLACLGVGACLSFVTYAASVAPLSDGKRMGRRGLKRRRAIEQHELWRTVEPVVRWLGMRVSGLMPEPFRQRLDYQVSIAGDYLGLLPEEVVGLSILSGLGGLVLGSGLAALSGMGALAVLGCTVFGAMAPNMNISSAAAARFKAVNRRLPYAIDLLALGMGAGLDFPAAVRQVVQKSGAPDDPTVEEFTLILQGLQLGRTRRQALEEFAARVPTDAVNEFVGAVVQAELRGNPVANVLRIQAEVSRQRRSVHAEEAAARASVAMVAPLMLVFVAILLLIVAPMAMSIHL